MKNDEELKKFITKLALGAGKILKKRFKNLEYIKFKDEFGDPVTDADYAAEDYVISRIIKKFPDHNILSEEGGIGNSKRNDYMWIIDPLDGTANFSLSMPVFCVSIALTYKGEIILGAIYDPIHDEMFFGQKNKGAFLNGVKIKVSSVIEQKRSRAMMVWGDPGETISVQKKLIKNDFKKWRFNGSAAISFAYFTAGRMDIYLAFTYKIWDIAAGVIIAREAGAKITDFDGREWNIKSKNMIATNKILHKKILSAIK